MSVFFKDRRELWVGIGLSASLTGIILGMFWVGGFEWLEQHSYDLRMQWRGTEIIDVPVVLVLNDESTSEELGVAPSRVSRMVYGQAIQNLHRDGAELIVMDVLFADSQSELEDASLEKAIRLAGNVILARYIGSDGHRVSLKRFTQVARGQGLINVSPDSDGVLRGVPFLGGHYDEGQMTPILTLGAEAARQFTASEGGASLEFLSRDKAQIGSLAVPLVHNQVLVNFAGPSGTVPSFPLWKVAQGKFPKDQFHGHIVLVGSNVASLHDFYHIPLPNKKIQTVGGATDSIHTAQMAGVEIHANVVRTLLGGKGIGRSRAGVVLGLIGLLGTLCCITVILAPRGELGVIVAIIMLLSMVIGATLLLFFYENYWLDVVPLLAVLNGHFAMATAYQRYLVVRQKDQLRLMFSHFLSPTVVANLWRQRASFFIENRIVPRQLEPTILMVKIRNMSEVIHSLEYEELLSWWSHYRRDLTRVLRQYGGLVSAWEDEAVRVYFGAPLPSSSLEAVTHDAQQAVNCAFQILQTANVLNEQWKKNGVPALELLAILYTAPAIGGSIHDSEGGEYRVMGEVTQMTNRLDQWARECDSLPKGGLVIAGESTVGYVGASWHTKNIGDIKEWTGNGTVRIYQIQEPVSPSTYTTSLGKGL